MREMKNSSVEWIGEIPAEWDFLRAKTIFRQRLTKGNEDEVLLAATQKYGMYPQYLLEGVVQVKVDTDLQLFKTVHKNDFVISLRSFQGGFEISDYEGVCSPAYQVFYNFKEIDHRFYKLLFKSDGFISKMNSLTVGIREGKNILFKDFADSLIPVPPLSEQHRIADFLDEKCAKIDAVIEKQKQVIEKLKEYKLSVITEAVTKGLDPTVPMKDSGVEWIGKIPEEWNLVKLKYAINKIGDIDHYMPESVDEGIPYLMTGDLKENVSSINFNACKKVSVEDYQALCKKMSTQKGDIIFARYATIGTVAYVDVECDFLVSYSCVTIRVNKRKLNGKYLFFYLKSKTFFEEVKKYINANTQGNVGIDSLNKVRMPLPPIDTQKTVVDYIERESNELDLAIAKKQVIVEKLTEYKKSLIYEVVTGKKEV